LNIEFDGAFLKGLKKSKNTQLLAKIKSVILHCEISEAIEEIKNCKKLTGHDSYYRIRIGDYRLGLKKVDNQTLRFITFAHRRDIYQLFP